MSAVLALLMLVGSGYLFGDARLFLATFLIVWSNNLSMDGRWS